MPPNQQRQSTEGRKSIGIRPVKNRPMRCWCGYLSGVRCRLFAYGPADATFSLKPHHLLPHLNPDWFYLSCTDLPGCPGKEAVPLNGCSSFCSSWPLWWRGYYRHSGLVNALTNYTGSSKPGSQSTESKSLTVLHLSHGSVATRLRCGGIGYSDIVTFTAGSHGERMCRHSAKLRARYRGTFDSLLNNLNYIR